jgi:transposase
MMLTAPGWDRFVSMVEHMVEPPRTVRRLEVITTASGRRRWSQSERRRILAEAMAPGAVVSVVARR